MTFVVPLLLLAPLVLVPLGLRLLDSIAAGASPDRRLQVAVVPAALLLAASFAMPAGGTAAALSIPWLVVTGLVALGAARRLLRDQDRFRPGPRHAADAAVAFLAVGASFATTDRLGVRPFDFSTTIILLTAVHFHFAGFVLPVAGALAHGRRPRRWLEVAIGLVIIGIPTTAVGFFGIPIVNWAGSMLVATGGLGIGLGTLQAVGTMARWPRVLARIAGGSLLVSMPMAAVYATGTLAGSTWLDLSTMAKVHGGLNALGFALAVILAWTLQRRAVRDRTAPADPLDVMSFNWPPFVIGPLLVVVGLVVGIGSSWPAGAVILVVAIVGAVLSALAIIAILWVFGWSSQRRWAWVVQAAGRPASWRNITTGFDDSTSQLRRTLPTSDGGSVDVFDETIDHERALIRARHRFPPGVRPTTATAISAAVAIDRFEAVFLLMSAHEADGPDRASLFAAAARSLTADGRLIVVEHLRDLPNILAFGPGAWHFQPRETWIGAASDAGLALVSETPLSPFVRGFVFGSGAS